MHCANRNETILFMVVVRAGAIGKKLLVKLNSPSSSPPARALLPHGSVTCPEDPLQETAPSGPRCWQFGTELRKFGRPLPVPSVRAAVHQRLSPPYSSGQWRCECGGSGRRVAEFVGSLACVALR